MANTKNNKRISKFLKVERDILPHGVVAIWSGVGSGKNTFIEGYHKDDEDVRGLIEDYRVLLITSRKSKVTETLDRNEENFNPYIKDIRYMTDLNWNEYDKSVVCTSAHIKARIEKHWHPLKANTYFWREFDFVVIDEFHSIITDSTFADSSYIMKCFIQKVYEDCIKDKSIDEIRTRLIFMSATPDATKDLLTQYSVKEYNLMDDTIFVKPKRINFTFHKDAVEKIKDNLKKGKKVAYYMCMLDKIYELIEIAHEVGLKDSQIAVSVSDKTTNRKLDLKYKNIFDNKESVEEELSKSEIIQDDIHLFITNSKNKEGINIKTDFDLLVMEHHYYDDIAQICGRFRNGVKNVLVIYDAKQFDLPIPYYREEEYQQKSGIKSANDFLYKLAIEERLDLATERVYDNEELCKFINYIEKTTHFVRFNPFKSKFEINDCYIKARKRYYEILRDFEQMMIDLKYNRIVSQSGYFKNITLSYTDYEDPNEWIESYFRDNGYEFGVTIFGKKEEKKLLKHLNRFYCKHPNTKGIPYKNLGSLIKFFGCEKISKVRTEKGLFTICKIQT